MKTVFWKAVASVMLLSGLIPQQQLSAEPAHRIAIVIDDFGNNMKGTGEMFKLPIPITAAIMPFMPSTHADANRAHDLGLDVIVHMPMEPNQGRPEWLGPGALFSRMTDEQIRSAVEKAIDDVPHAVGMNNHMGSKITRDARIMAIVLQVCKERGLFFLDSRTSYKTVVPKVAAEVGVPVLGNDVFLDDIDSASHIDGQIEKLKKLSAGQADSISIGHVGSSGLLTSGALRRAAAGIGAGTRFVRLSELVPSSAEEKLVLPHP